LAEKAAIVNNHSSSIILNTLAAAYAESGRFADAVEVSQKSLQLAESVENGNLALIVRGRIELYKKSVPLHQADLSKIAD
jgi:two-component SAPR family response regulator